MLNVEDVFKRFEQLHSYSFATINDGYPDIRIAHFVAWDEGGLYFQTMKVKPFYKQLKETKKVAVLSLVSKNEKASHDEMGLSEFPPGFFIRLKGDVKEVDFDQLKQKAKNDSKFMPLVKDIERYPTMTTFVVHRYSGELYDFDFEKKHRDHKLERERFNFNGFDYINCGFVIQKDKCIACGSCYKACTFNAIEKGDKYYKINGSYCDECGSCYSVCPTNAVIAKTPMSEEDRNLANRMLKSYMHSNK
ncbi:MAG: 4Fe-4S binding protein [Sphaerochaetaceae bacterium]|nr:4Fe-4S binding protein [Sphaerochaetaceae bacterium]MDC7238122.1 4Fe-4S binding protein [Sphaerochaetaceae bacterium]